MQAKGVPCAFCALTPACIGAAFHSVQNWGGGAFCATNYQHLPTTYANCTIPGPNGTSTIATCYNADIKPMCSGNGGVLLPYGHAEYVGMGFLVSGARKG